MQFRPASDSACPGLEHRPVRSGHLHPGAPLRSRKTHHGTRPASPCHEPKNRTTGPDQPRLVTNQKIVQRHCILPNQTHQCNAGHSGHPDRTVPCLHVATPQTSAKRSDAAPHAQGHSTPTTTNHNTLTSLRKSPSGSAQKATYHRPINGGNASAWQHKYMTPPQVLHSRPDS